MSDLSCNSSQIGYPGVHPFYIIPDIQHDAGEDVEYQRETYRQKGRVNKKQPYLADRYIKFFTEVSAHAK